MCPKILTESEVREAREKRERNEREREREREREMGEKCVYEYDTSKCYH